MSKKAEAWAFWANTSGPWSKGPVAIYQTGFQGRWYDSSGDRSVEFIGLEESEGFVCFSSKSKAEVEKFIRGFMACRRIGGRFFGAK